MVDELVQRLADKKYLFTVVTEADVELERPGTNYKDNGKRWGMN